MEYANIEILELPWGAGKTTKAIEYALKEALKRKISYIAFDDSVEYLCKKACDIAKRLYTPEEHKIINENLKLWRFTSPIDFSTVVGIIAKNDASGIVFDGVEWLKTYSEKDDPMELFAEFAGKLKTTFFVTKQCPKTKIIEKS